MEPENWTLKRRKSRGLSTTKSKEKDQRTSWGLGFGYTGSGGSCIICYAKAA
jgi:hypothetical protein